MLIEVSQSKDHATGLARIAEVVRRCKAGKGFYHPIIERLNAKPSNGPVLVFDINRIERRMAWLHELAKPLSIRTLVAVKSCPASRYLEAGQKLLDGFDVSSPAEYACLPDNLEGKLVSLTSPDLSIEMEGFVSKGNAAVITLDSYTQLDRYFCQKPRIPYLLRIQGPDFLTKDDPGHYSKTRFGFSIKEVHHLLQRPQLVANPPMGFHVHHGSERNAVSTYRSIVEGLKILTQQACFRPLLINLGGGWHGMNKEEISSILMEARDAFPTPCSIVLEPGRWYAVNTGFAVSTIVNQAASGSTFKFVVNISRECHLKWSRVNLVYTMVPRARRFCEVQIYGPSCYEGDMIGSFLLPYSEDFYQESGFSLGAQVIFSGVSQYSVGWNTSFNGIQKAEIVWWEENMVGSYD